MLVDYLLARLRRFEAGQDRPGPRMSGRGKGDASPQLVLVFVLASIICDSSGNAEEGRRVARRDGGDCGNVTFLAGNRGGAYLTPLAGG